MSTLLEVNDISLRNHWESFAHWVDAQPEFRADLIGIGPWCVSAEPFIKRFNGKFIYSENNTWLKFIEFDTEEDLLIFKLTFN